MLNVFEMSASLGLDSSEFENGLGNAEGKTNNLSATTVAVGKVMADTFEAVIRKVGEFASEVVEAGAQQEAALAKVNTIMDKSVMNTDAMGGAIKDLSSEMGVSVSELSDTVYNAISATGDTAHAVELAGQASKLASAGFTDTSSALSVLTTAMNAYGLEADQTQHISDSLITVQNLGVTTVSELSSSMGKAIASASAYGVNLENLESAYISITKAGINTAEGTTYISSMMKELGDDGTDVAKILKEETGMAFNELLNAVNPATNELYSMGDVLGILYESVGEDSTALMNLWSSAEAGKASSAIVGQGLDDFNEHLKQLQNTSGETETAYETMADTFEHKQEVMNTKLENMKATLFENLEPLLMNFFDWMESTGMPVLEMLVDNIDIIAPIVLGVVTALGGLTIALTITKMIESLKTAFIALNAVMLANPIGIIIALVAGLIVALVGLYNSNEEFRNKVNSAWEAIKSVVGGVVDALITFFTVTIPDAADALLEKIQSIPQWFDELPYKIAYALGTAIGHFILWVQNMITEAPRVGSEVVEKVSTFFSTLPSRMWEHLVNAFNNFTKFISNLASTIYKEVPKLIKAYINFWVTLPKKMHEIGHNIVEGLWNGLKERWQWLKDKVGELVQGLVDGVKDTLGIHSPSRVFASIGNFMAAGLEEGWDDAFGNVYRNLMDDLDFSATPFSFGNIDELQAIESKTVEVQNNVTVTLEGDARRLFKAMQQESKNYNTITGRPAFS